MSRSRECAQGSGMLCPLSPSAQDLGKVLAFAKAFSGRTLGGLRLGAMVQWYGIRATCEARQSRADSRGIRDAVDAMRGGAKRVSAVMGNEAQRLSAGRDARRAGRPMRRTGLLGARCEPIVRLTRGRCSRIEGPPGVEWA